MVCIARKRLLRNALCSKRLVHFVFKKMLFSIMSFCVPFELRCMYVLIRQTNMIIVEDSNFTVPTKVSVVIISIVSSERTTCFENKVYLVNKILQKSPLHIFILFLLSTLLHLFLRSFFVYCILVPNCVACSQTMKHIIK